jgi:predicted phage tail protein
MEELAAGTIVSRIRKELEEAADEILEISKVLAHKNHELNALKDDQASREAKWRVQVATVLNEQNKPKYANLDAQNAAVTMALNADDDYGDHKVLQLDTALEIEMRKAQLIRLHEKRRDSRTEAELLVGLLKGE